MLRIILLLVTLTSFFTTMKSQTQNYIPEWTAIEADLKKGKSSDALKKTEQLFAKANADKNAPHAIRAIMHLVGLKRTLAEEAEQKSYWFIDSVIGKTNGVAKNILYSMQAEYLKGYLNQNRWRIQNRTALAEAKSNDIQTWSIDKLNETIGKLYLASLKDAAALQATPTSNFDVIVLKGNNTENLRPTIYDLLTFRALDFFSHEERYVTKPAYYFELNDDKIFDEANNFAKHKFTTKDTESHHYQALLLYQQLLAFRLKNNPLDALIDVDLLRLQFVHNYSTSAKKDELYQNALQKIVQRNSVNNAEAAYAAYLIETQQVAKATPEIRIAVYAKAIETYNKIILLHKNKRAGIEAQNQLNNIYAKQLNVEAESVNLPNEPFRINVQYKNVEKVYIRVIPFTKIQALKWEDEYNIRWSNLAKMSSAKTYTIELPKTLDYDEHKAEIKIDALPIGMYGIALSTTADFSTSKNILTNAIVHVSNIGLIKEETNTFYVVNRNTGKPLPKATVKVYNDDYDYNERKRKKALHSTLTTDNDGKVTIAGGDNNNRSKQLDIYHEKDQLELLTSHYIYHNDYYNYPQNFRSFLFTDRNIYRPGQVVHFKGILYKKAEAPQQAYVIANSKITVELLDANYQVAQKLELTTNAYGSYSGVFTLPTGGLGGQFQIRDNLSRQNKYFSVEEYKRPKFSVTTAQPKNNYKLNDSIKITATAKAFAGNNIDGAKVKYTVTRKVNYPSWCYDYYYYRGRGGWWPGNNNNTVAIANGTATTNKKGEVDITFKAIPDATVDRKYQPTFTYEVVTEITDQNGETRVGNATVNVRYQSVQLELTSVNKVMAHNVQKIMVNSTNNNGGFTPAKVNLTIKKLTAPVQYLRDRYWTAPDQFIYTEAEFKKWFPLDIYKNENAKQNWPSKEIYAAQFTTVEKTAHALQNLKLEPGYYLIEASTKDISGDTVKTLEYVELTGENKNYFTNELAITADKENYVPNDVIKYDLKTSFDNIYVLAKTIYNHSKNDGAEQNTIDYITVAKQPISKTIAVAEDNRGGIGLNAAFVKYNRFFSETKLFAVPWTNKELEIKFGTFRDKTLPGSEEQFTVTIKGEKNTKVAAELLATMYDASLDQLKASNDIKINNLYYDLYMPNIWSSAENFRLSYATQNNEARNDYKYYQRNYDHLGVNIIDKKKHKNRRDYEPAWWTSPLDNSYDGADVVVVGYGKAKRKSAPAREEALMAGAPAMEDKAAEPMAAGSVKMNVNRGKNFGSDNDNDGTPDNLERHQAELKTKAPENAPLKIRKNFNETAFFLPNLETNAEGDIIIKYTIPEALTSWKLQTLAHTKDMSVGSSTKTVVTQKPLMVQPNIPRFLREGDKVELAVKVANLSDKEVTGVCKLELINPETNQSVDGWYKNMFPQQFFTVAAGQSGAVQFPLEIPFGYNKPLIIRLSAVEQAANGYSDAEENIVPVVTNRMLVTETMPIYVNGSGTKTYSFDKLKNNKSESLQHHALTVEYSPNPIWYAIQALPYLMEYPYECAEQTFNRYYANALASYIANSTPKIKSIFDRWAVDGKALQSNLQKNQELKSAVLEETPWVVEAQNEAQQKKNLAILFDVMRMQTEQESSLKKLMDLQTPNGGFSWFKGGYDNEYITEYIATGFGHLNKLGVVATKPELNQMLAKAVTYVDARVAERYKKLTAKDKSSKEAWTYMHSEVYYLYMRSFYKNIPMSAAATAAHDFYLGKMKENWLRQNRYSQAMIAMIANRNSDTGLAKTIVESLKQNAIINDELGMYWKEIQGGYYWHESPVETVSTIVEAFNEITKDTESIGLMQKWLLKNKQTTNWKTTKATSEACYALLINQTNKTNGLVINNNEATITVGNVSFDNKKENAEAGTGYFKKRIEGEMVKPEMANVTIKVVASNESNTSGNASFGAVYWQYFEDMDKITSAATPLQLKKKLYKETNTDKGKKLVEIKENDVLNIGDKMITRIELKVDRDMEYVHMKDMRSSGVEPVNVLSTYKWQDGLGYYESTKDISTNFFFDYLRKGTYVFEYPVYVSHKGKFSNGITTIQCMYAPEFTSHSEGVKVNVE